MTPIGAKVRAQVPARAPSSPPIATPQQQLEALSRETALSPLEKAARALALLEDASALTPVDQASIQAFVRAQSDVANGAKPALKGGKLAQLAVMTGKALGPADAIKGEPTFPPTGGTAAAKVDVKRDADGDGVTDHALVGIGGRECPPVTVKAGGALEVGAFAVRRLPNLTATERLVEERACGLVERNLGALIGEYAERRAAGEIGDAPNVFSTDDVKLLFADYNPPPRAGESDDAHGARSRAAKGAFNMVVHQAANALAKAAFAAELAALPKGSHIMMTTGGTGAGKGFAIGNIDSANQVAARAAAVWDSAGEQAATEAPWVLELARKHGHVVTFVHVENGPKLTWTNEKFGILPRWEKSGRGPSVDVSVNSYIDSARNMAAFYARHKGAEDAQFVVIKNGHPPKVLDDAEIGPELAKAGGADRRALNEAIEAHLVARTGTDPSILRGALIGRRLFGDEAMG